jgi:cytochrome P450
MHVCVYCARTTTTAANTTIQYQKLIQERRAEGLDGRMDTLSEMIRGTTGGEMMTDEQIQDQVRTA